VPYDLIIIITGTLFVAAILHGSIGFGFPLVATPIIALFTDMQTAVFFTLIPTLLVNIVSIKSEANFLKVLKTFFPFALLSTVGSLIGTILLIQFNSDFFKLLLALSILFYLFMPKLNDKNNFIQQHPKKSMGLFSIGAGLVGGLTNAMAPVLIMYSVESKLTKSQTIQLSNLCFLFGKITQLLVFSLFASVSFAEVSFSLSTLLAVALALFIGIKVKKRINAKQYQVVIKSLLFIMAVMLVGQFLVFSE
jgi:uncharacterized membrane protein YfcA